MKTFARFLTVVFLLLAPLAHGATITVNSTADPAGFNPNINIPQLGATITLRDAVNAANNTAGDDEIIFAPGLAGQTLLLKQIGASTPITGPNDAMLSALSITTTVTIRGPAGGVTIARDQSVSRLRLILIASNGNLTVDGLTLADGVEGTGGAIQNHGTLTIRASTVRNCLANAFSLLPGYARGGGVYNAGTLTVTGSSLSNNTALITGGGIYNAAGAPLTVTNTLFNNCLAYISGGAIASLDSGGLSTVSGSTFIGNRVLGASGGVDQNDGFGGGAIKNRGVLAVSSSTFDNNSVDNGYNGGAINNSGTLNLARSTLVRNASNHTNIQAFGGGFENLGQATVTNCTFTQNRAKFGTAVSSRNGSTITLNHCTVVAQQVTPEIGAAVELQGTATITNAIICRNYYFSTFYNENRPLNVSGPFSGSNNVIDNETPGVGDLGNFGGPTQTMPLLFNSPALDAGIATAGVTTDQRGVARPQGPGVDIGAFESGGPPVITSANAATFISNTTNRFQVTASGLPAPTFSASGTLPPGVSLTSSGLLSGSPPVGSVGTYPFTITALNSLGQSSTQQFVLTVSATELIVTTAVDEDNGSTDPALGTGTSLREAFNRAMQVGGSPTIYFASALAGQTIQGTMGINYGDGPTAFRVITSVTIQGLTGDNGLTLARGITGDLRGFQVSSGTLTLNDLTLANWRAGYGAAILNFTSVRLNRCTVRNNSGEGIIRAGGFADATLENCTLANNEGGYAIQSNGFQTLRHVTVTGNTGGGLSPSANPSTAINSIIAGNTAGGTPADVHGRLSTTASVNNLIGTGGSGFLVNGTNGNIVGVPADQLLLGPLASNGGPTQTVALLPGSPAINNATTLVATDQRGIARPQGGAPDIGAFELPSPIVVTTLADENNGTSDPGFGTGTSLREAVAAANGSDFPATITFAPALAGQTVTLNTGWLNPGDSPALRVAGQIIVQGPTTAPGVTLAIAPGVQKRHFYVEPSGTLTLANLNLTGGNVSDVGGAIWNAGTLTVRACTLSGNSAGSQGGAIQSNFGTVLLVENTTISGNTSGNIASAIATGASPSTFRSLTITNNTGPNGPLYLFETPATLVNSIVAGNSNDAIATVGSGAFNAQSTNNILGSTVSAGLVNGANGNFTGVPASRLYLGALANNGGPTPTHALDAGSLAVNTGAVIAGLTTDQRGSARTGGSAPDIGAFEDQVGNDDPDGDTLTNVQELALNTNPTSLDSDGDGFNDPTELMASSDPNSAASFPPASHISRVLGFGPARGLDLSGNFRYAFNVGTPGAAGQAGDANFTADSASGITVSAPNEIANWAVREFGNTPADDVLETVYRSIRWADLGNANPDLRKLKVDLANLVPGRNYKLQLLIEEATNYHRAFDIFINGTLVVPGFAPNIAQGNPTAAAAVVHEFTAPTSTLHVELSGASTPPGIDPNPVLNGVTLEELPTAAAAPLITPASGTYENTVTVSLSTTALGATIRYTTDGSTPSAASGFVYSAPFSLVNSATVRVIAVNGGWLPSTVASANYTIVTPLQTWRTLHSLSPDGSQDLANPSGDGIANLLKYAFNMAPNFGDLAVPNVGELPENGTAGLPFIAVDAQGRLVIEFVRRKAATGPGIAYLVETGVDLTNLQPLNLSGATIVSIDATWERVTVTDPVITSKRFSRVRVLTIGTYVNDFNAGLGAATLRGNAVWTNQAVQLTDAIGGQIGAVVLDGIIASPALSGFTAKFNVSMGATTTGIPADGVSFAIGDLGAAAWSETGPGTAHSLAVGFDTYDNGGAGSIGIHAWVNGTHVASDPTNPYTNGASVPVEISYDSITGLTVRFNGATIFNQLPVPGFSFQSGDRFGLGARTGGANERAVVDDVEIAPR